MIIILLKGWILSGLETIVRVVLEYLKQQGCIQKNTKRREEPRTIGLQSEPTRLHNRALPGTRKEKVYVASLNFCESLLFPLGL
jgi:hypothetical protein